MWRQGLHVAGVALGKPSTWCQTQGSEYSSDVIQAGGGEKGVALDLSFRAPP